MKRRPLIFVAGSLIVAGALVLLGLYLLPPATTEPAEPEWADGGPPPAEAVETVRRLSSADPAQRRSSLSPGLAEIVAEVRETAGSTVTLDPQGWRGDDAYGAATAVWRAPGQPDRGLVLGFQWVDGRWQITFEEPM
ncbi:hypothetical protein [Amycolatopsis japonica]